MLARRMGRVTSSAIMELIKTTAAGDYISFASGLPDPALFPLERLREITDEVLARDGRGALQYGAAEGYAPLREYVAAMLARRGLPAAPEQILITNGSQQALDLAARALLDPGDPVAIESPSYLAAIQIFEACEASYRSLPTDGDGLRTEALAALAPPLPKLLYLLPNFQNPTGSTLPLERRRRAAEWASGSGVPLLEDDAYHDLRYEGEPLPPLAALAPNPAALYTGTFSKTIVPGLRVGFLCGPAALVERLAQLKQIADLQSGSLSQRVVYEYCARGYLEPGIAALRAEYRARRDRMLAELETHLAGRARWSRPQGGMFVWVTLPEGQSAAALLRRCLERGVVFVPGAPFHPAGGGEHTFRLNFVSAPPERIAAGIRLLAEAVREGAE